MIGWWFVRVVMGCMCGKETIEIDGRQYYMKKRLAEGGFSMVYLVEERKTGKDFALKRIVCYSVQDEKGVLDEINLHNRIAESANVNVIPCIGYTSSKMAAHRTVVYEHENNFVVDTVEYNILLPYYKRGTLLEELSFRNVSGDRILEGRVLKLFKDVCCSIKAFHQLKPEPYAHRDIKPGNILFTDDDAAILMDLGSASLARKRIKDSKEAQILKDYAAENCSMCYRAPELFHVESGATITEKSDIWSLGCLLYAMCFTKSPFDNIYERGDSVALAVLAGNITVPSKSCYSEGVHKLIQDMIRVNPEERPDIDRVIDQIASLQGQKSVV